MDVFWLGHSCFRVKGKRATVVTDPFPPDLGYALGEPVADIVTVSHQHPGHSFMSGVSGVNGSPHNITGPGEYEVSGVLIIGFPTFHDAEKGAQWGKNNVYLMEIDGITICHLGDLGHPLNTDQVEEIDEVDVLLLPVGGVSTIDAACAAETIRRIEPKIVIPMHFKTPELKRELDPVEKFLKEMGAGQVEPLSKLSITPSSLPASTQVVLLSYKAG